MSSSRTKIYFPSQRESNFQPNQFSIAKAGKFRNYGFSFAKPAHMQTYDSVPPYHALGTRGLQPLGPSPNTYYHDSLAIHTTAPLYNILQGAKRADLSEKRCFQTPDGQCISFGKTEDLDDDNYHPMYDKVQCKTTPPMDICTPFTWYRYRR